MHKEFFEVLRTDHELFKKLLLQLKQTAGSETKSREELFAVFKLAIEPHTKAEEEVFYPPLEKIEEVYEDVLESVEEHHVISLIIDELDRTPKHLDLWMAKLRVCIEVVEHHILEEEDKIFEAATRFLTHDKMQSVLKTFETTKEILRIRMSNNWV